MDTIAYSPIALEFIKEVRLAELGPGHADEAMRPRLKKLTAAALFAPETVRDGDLAQACLAGLWLYHDFLDESHQLSQDLENSEGAYWHGLMHRREPDFANSKYWFRRVGQHEVFAPLARAAAELAGKAEPHPAARFLAAGSTWDPFAFIELCEQSFQGKVPCESLCRLVQETEWRMLFDYCYQHALRGK
jgi:hypothetical protein